MHYEEHPHDFTNSDAALSYIKNALYAAALSDAQVAGAEQIEVTLDEDIKVADIESREVFVEALITATAKGRPRIAH